MFGQKFCFSFVPSFSSVIFLLYLIFIFVCLASTQRKSDWEEGEVGELRHENNKNGIDDEMDEGSGDSFNPDDEDDIESSGLPPKELDETPIIQQQQINISSSSSSVVSPTTTHPTLINTTTTEYITTITTKPTTKTYLNPLTTTTKTIKTTSTYKPPIFPTLTTTNILDLDEEQKLMQKQFQAALIVASVVALVLLSTLAILACFCCFCENSRRRRRPQNNNNNSRGSYTQGREQSKQII
ncbi:unnamed protein product [Meloidogyne enterolobii]|uniref:Uncharacterized protein n=1 Tax=Meloidogyne enterolobii TaxID=390850 RepID=A0ACB0ZNA8_MELEN